MSWRRYWDRGVGHARGRPLAELPQGPDRRAVYADLGRVLRKLHGIKGTGAGFVVEAEHGVVTGCHDAWWRHVHCRMREHTDYAREHGLMGFRDQFVLMVVEPTDGYSLLHGDLSDHNVFAEGGAVTALIDWESALLGDPITRRTGTI